MKQLLLRGMMVDDLLDDWSKYCRAHDMAIGGLPGEGVHSVLVVAEGRECHVNIANPDGNTAEETVRLFLTWLCQRRSELTLTEAESEEAARAASMLDETVAILIEE